MKYLKVIIPILASVMFSGCEFFDDMFKYDYQKNKLATQEDRIEFQEDSAPKTVLITSKCKYNEKTSFVYYMTPQEAIENYFSDTNDLISEPWSGKKLKPFWDIRYVNEVKAYELSDVTQDIISNVGMQSDNMNNLMLAGTDIVGLDKDASLVASKCSEGVLEAGTTINLFDAPEQEFTYEGPQSTYMYRIADINVSKPWKSNKSGNLMIEARFNKPVYQKNDKNIGGGVNFGLFIYNKKLNKHINYIVAVYAIGDSLIKEQAKLKFDPTTNIVHVETAIDTDTWWSTKSPKSEVVVRVNGKEKSKIVKSDFKHFYRVNITYDNLMAVLQELKQRPPEEVAGEDFETNPEDWEVESVFIQYELETEGGKAILSGSFRGFEVYTSKLPL